MDIFFITLVTGMATGFCLELISSLVSRWISTKLLRIILVLPTSYAGAYFLGVLPPVIWVVTAAGAFFALLVLCWLDKPVTITNIRR